MTNDVRTAAIAAAFVFVAMLAIGFFAGPMPNMIAEAWLPGSIGLSTVTFVAVLTA